MKRQDATLFLKGWLGFFLQFIQTAFVFFAMQSRALRKTIQESWSNEKARRFASRLWRVAEEDVRPIVLVGCANELAQTYLSDQIDIPEPEDGYALSTLGFFALVYSSKFVVSAIVSGYLFRKKLQFGVRMLAITLEATDVARSAVQIKNICEEEGCNTLRYLKGAVRDNVNYWVSDVLIRGVELIPVMGTTTATILSVYHQGRYVMTLVLPICNRHQEVYIIENPGLIMSHGFTYQFLSTVVPITIEYTTGFSREIYQSPLSQLFLIMQVSLAARMELPQPVSKAKRAIIDPVTLLVALIDLVFEVVLLGLKRYIPQRVANSEGSSIPWDKLLSGLSRIWSNPVVQRILFFILPRMLQSLHRFRNDQLISQHWESWRGEALIVIRMIKDYLSNPLVIAAAKMKTITVEVLHNTQLNLPKFVTRFLIDLARIPDIVNRLGDLERFLEAAYAGDPQAIIPSIKPYIEDVRPEAETATSGANSLTDDEDGVNLAPVLEKPVAASSVAADEDGIDLSQLPGFFNRTKTPPPVQAVIDDDEEGLNLDMLFK